MSGLKETISQYVTESPEAPMLAVSCWYRLCAALTEIVHTHLCQYHAFLQPSEQMYVKKAMQYIGGINKSQRSIQDIANHLNISEGYLHRIFKKTMNCTISEYINRQRISAIVELVKNKNLTLREAAYNVGIEDQSYASRLFRKVTGISFREFFTMHMNE